MHVHNLRINQNIIDNRYNCLCFLSLLYAMHIVFTKKYHKIVINKPERVQTSKLRADYALK